MTDTAAFHKLSYGLYIISATDEDGRKVGCVVNTFQQVANEPLTVSVALHKDNTTTGAIQRTGRFVAVSLTTETTMDLIGRFGFNSSYAVDKFAEHPFTVDETGIPYLTECVNARFSVAVVNEVDVGSHVMFIGCVQEAEVLSDSDSLTYDYYHSVLRGKTPPKAVSFNSEDEATASAPCSSAPPDENAPAAAPRIAWRCTLCGYVEEGYPEGLPEDYQCPWCGAGREMFERIEL